MKDNNSLSYKAKYLKFYYPLIISIEIYFIFQETWGLKLNSWVLFMIYFNTFIGGYIISIFLDGLVQYIELEINVRKRHKKIFGRYRNRK